MAGPADGGFSVSSAPVTALPALNGASAILAHPPKVKGMPGGWITSQDYPTQALRNGEQGTVHFLVTVDETGAPIACEVTGTSGSRDLDDATCQLALKRAQFFPATDKAGAATVGYYFNSSRWFIPESKPAPDSSELIVTFTVGADGVPGNCVVVSQGGEAAAKFARKAGVCPSGTYDSPYRGAQGQPITQRVTIATKITVADGQ